MKKLYPHLLGIIGFLIWFFGITTLNTDHKQILNLILIPLGTLLFSFSGYLIIKVRKFTFGFFEIKGWLAILYGVLFIVVGLYLTFEFLLSIFSK